MKRRTFIFENIDTKTSDYKNPNVGDILEVGGSFYKVGYDFGQQGFYLQRVSDKEGLKEESKKIFEDTPLFTKTIRSSKIVKEFTGEKDMSLDEDLEAGYEDDLDIGHVDDEPGMLKNTIYDIVQYGAKLYKDMDKLSQHPGEVDLPNWFQSKIILSRDYISKAQHYLEYKLREPGIDQDMRSDISPRLDSFLRERVKKRK